jgi:putative transposase
MPRTARVAPGGMLFHVLNRGVGRMRLFLKDADFEAFERIVTKTLDTRPMRIVAYALLPNHWHFVLWPAREGALAAFMQKLTITHARNWQENRRRVGKGKRKGKRDITDYGMRRKPNVIISDVPFSPP